MTRGTQLNQPCGKICHARRSHRAESRDFLRRCEPCELGAATVASEERKNQRVDRSCDDFLRVFRVCLLVRVGVERGREFVCRNGQERGQEQDARGVKGEGKKRTERAHVRYKPPRPILELSVVKVPIGNRAAVLTDRFLQVPLRDAPVPAFERVVVEHDAFSNCAVPGWLAGR